MLRKPTEWLRVVVDQNGRGHVNNQQVPQGGPVLPPEDGAGAGTYRKVQVCVPQEPQVFLSLTQPPNDAGPGRTGYQWAPVPPDKAILVRLQPEQQIYLTAASGGGFAVCSLIVEYCEGGD